MIYQINNVILSVVLILISFLIMVGVSAFILNWGFRIQLIKKDLLKKLYVVSILPGIIYILIILGNSLLKDLNFIDIWGFHLIRSVIFNIIFTISLKRLSFRTIAYEELQQVAPIKNESILIDVDNLKISYPIYGGMVKRMIGEVKAVDGVSFKIHAGETIGLVGESGCGKSTIAKHILGLVDRIDGNVKYKEQDLIYPLSLDQRKKNQIVFQDPSASLNPRMKIVDIISEPLRNLMGITEKQKLRDMCMDLMEKVSLKREHLDRFPHEFSGGQMQRIIIARALASNPELIILDEPTSALDVSVQAQILNLLKVLQQNNGYGYLFISHNLAVVHHIAHRVYVMYLGKIVESGTVDQIFQNSPHPYTQALLASRSKIEPGQKRYVDIISGEVPSPVNPPSGCTFHPRCKYANEECSKTYPNTIEMEPGHKVSCARYLN
jgi:oligopeptide/dipeptide ABC transporter ATP-binding protein